MTARHHPWSGTRLRPVYLFAAAQRQSNMALRLKSKEGSKKASPPEPAPSYMDSKQFGTRHHSVPSLRCTLYRGI